jgi:hypothetical protein
MEAAKGDKIYTSFYRYGYATERRHNTFIIESYIYGGTGRFENVSGYFHHIATGNPASPLGFIEVKGEISY